MPRLLSPAEWEVFGYAALVLAKENNVEIDQAFAMIDEIVHQHKTLDRVLPILIAIAERYAEQLDAPKTLH